MYHKSPDFTYGPVFWKHVHLALISKSQVTCLISTKATKCAYLFSKKFHILNYGNSDAPLKTQLECEELMALA